jgi:hypothetical protein
MRSRTVLDALTALTLVIWLNIVGGLLVPQFAEAANRPNEFCDPAFNKSCTPYANGCGGCTPGSQAGGCSGGGILCTTTNGACNDGTGCHCNPTAC